jgi:hypothetical protein
MCVTRSLTPGCCHRGGTRGSAEAVLERKLQLQAWYSRFPPNAVDPAADKAEPDAAADKSTVDVADFNGNTKVVEGHCFQMLNKFAPTCFLARGARS